MSRESTMTEKSKTTYTYSPIRPICNSIRLLRLFPASRRQDPIHCQLFDYSLAIPPRTSHLYECLSYVWGSAVDKLPIYIDGAEIAVTQNLYGALQRLRDPSIDRVLWVDAVCINQEDVDEKTKQVQSMAMIYAYASRVVVWLGEEADGSSEAMELLREEASRVYREQRSIQGGEKKDPDEDMFKVREPPVWPALRSQAGTLLSRPWFRRVWVLQEIAAARVITVMCGFEEVTGACFYWGLSGLLSLFTDTSRYGPISSMVYLLGDASVLQLEKGYRNPFRLGLCPLSQLIDMFGEREATDRRDKVYALLGIASRDSVPPDLLPNYGIKWTFVFKDLVRSILGQKVEAVWKSNDGMEYGHITGKGRVVGYISGLETSKSDRQTVYVTPCRFSAQRQDDEVGSQFTWTVHNSATAVHHGDIVCCLEGSTGATIIRPHRNCFTIVIISAELSKDIVEDLFRKKPSSTDPVSHDGGTNELWRPFRYSRVFHLVWIFDSGWTTGWIDHVQLSEEGLAHISTTSFMLRVLEDVNDIESLKEVLESGITELPNGQKAPMDVEQHLLDFRQILPNWNLYMRLKHTLQRLISLQKYRSHWDKYVELTSSLQRVIPDNNLSFFDIALDVVEIRTRLSVASEKGIELFEALLKDICATSLDNKNEGNQRLMLAFLFDVWGHSISSETKLSLDGFDERMGLIQPTIGNPPEWHLDPELSEVAVELRKQYHERADSLIEALVYLAKNDSKRMYCLLSTFLLCSEASLVWKRVLAGSILLENIEEVFKALANEVDSSRLGSNRRYTEVVNLLLSYHGISTEGKYYLDSYRFWEACYNGRVFDIRSAIENEAIDIKVVARCKDPKGAWCYATAFEAAAMYGHIECCEVLLTSGRISEVTSQMWGNIRDRGSISNVSKIAKLIGTYKMWEVSEAAKDYMMVRGKYSTTMAKNTNAHPSKLWRR